LRTLKLSFLILVPAAILVIAFADKLLFLFGRAYVQSGTTLIRILALSSLPLAVNYIYMSMLRVQMRLRTLLILSGGIAATTLVGSYILLRIVGINGTGLSWLGAQTIAAVVVIGFLWREFSLSRKR